MLRNMTWVLLRPDMAWHVLDQHQDDYRGFFDRPTLCEFQTPADRLGVIAFSQAMPPEMSNRMLVQFADGDQTDYRMSICKACQDMLQWAHQKAKTDGLARVMAGVREPMRMAA